MVIGLLIFYACCLQCAATLAIIRRETNTWRWPIFAWAYMTIIGYVGALLAFVCQPAEIRHAEHSGQHTLTRLRL
jgi:ferrous iron transport protein B